LAQAVVPKPPGPEPRVPSTDADDARATQLARGIHAQSSMLDRQPKFSYVVKYRNGDVDSMRAVDLSLDRFKEALTAPVLDRDWFGWYGMSFSWDQERFLWEIVPREADLPSETQFWTRTDAWARYAAKDGSSTNYTRAQSPATFWKSLVLFNYSYLRLTPRRFWWGRTTRPNAQAMNLIPPEDSTWKPLGTESFVGEICDVVDSPERFERLWIGRESRLLRGVLSSYGDVNLSKVQEFYQSEPLRKIAGKVFSTSYDYINWLHGEASEDQVIQASIAWEAFSRHFKPSTIRPNELAIFDDYREVAPGLRLPFREVRVFPHASEAKPDKHKLIRSELVVESVRTDLDLSARFAELMPKDGDPVQDQRFQVALDLRYKADRPDDEIRKLSEVEYAKRLKGQLFIDGLVEPIAAMVGQPAPALPP
ncbi:sigma-70 family RNA polymerase sigma factor, partial [Singulisphaera rosea]